MKRQSHIAVLFVLVLSVFLGSNAHAHMSVSHQVSGHDQLMDHHMPDIDAAENCCKVHKTSSSSMSFHCSFDLIQIANPWSNSVSKASFVHRLHSKALIPDDLRQFTLRPPIS